MSIADLPKARASGDPTGPCLADDSAVLDNQTFARRVAAAASVLRDHGVGPGSIVAVCLPNCADLVITLFAAWRLGAAVTPVNPALTTEEARYQIEDANAVVVIAADGRPGCLDVSELNGASAADPAGPPTVVSADSDLALVIYTSGTTGRPKGVMLDHANLSAMARMIIGALDLTAADHSLLMLPLFHVNGIVVSILSVMLRAGGPRSRRGSRHRPSSISSSRFGRPTSRRYRPSTPCWSLNPTGTATCHRYAWWYAVPHPCPRN